MNHDDGKLALGLFDSMHVHGMKPDAITFACVLSACGRANLVVKGRQIFKMMNEAHRISPMIDHFTCMVDLLARAGKLDEAEKLLESSPFSPPKDMWRALLSACIKYAEIGIGQRHVARRSLPCRVRHGQAVERPRIALIASHPPPLQRFLRISLPVI